MTRAQHWQEAFKFALALGLSYMAALAMNWTHPLWAAFSVMTCSLATAGASLERGILRLTGTLAGSALGIVLVAQVSHSRWLMFSVELLIITICAAGAITSRYWYAWLMIAFVNVLVFSDAYPYWELSFEVAIERTSETALGILIYMLVSSLLWPRYTGEALERCVSAICKQLIQLYDLARSERKSGAPAATFEQARSELITMAATFDETLPAALVDTPSLHGQRRAWHAWRAELAVFVNALTLWRGSFRHIRGLSMSDLVPDQRDLELLVKSRLERAYRAWEAPPADLAESMQPDKSGRPTEAQLARVPNVLQRAAIAGFDEELRLMSRSSAGLLAITKVLRGADPPSKLDRARRASRPTHAVMLDRDSLVRIARPAIAWSLAFLAWIYLDGLPGGPALLPFVVALSIAASFLNLPDVGVLAKPYAIGVVTAAPIYFFVLPQLESPLALFFVLVVYGLPWGYVGSRGNFFGKVLGVLPLLLCAGITNQPSFTFDQFAGSILVIGLGLACISLAGVFLPSSRPEHVLVRNLRDLLVCSAALGEARAGVLQQDDASDRTASRALRKVITLAHRLRASAANLETTCGPGPKRDGVRRLTSAVDLFAYQLEELEAISQQAAAESPEVYELAQTVGAKLRSDHVTVFRALARMGQSSEQRSMLSDIQSHLAEMESHLDERGLGDLGAAFTPRQLHRLYLLAGSWRILSEATSQLGEAIDALDPDRLAVSKP